jgi:hypothetical protein
LARISTLAGAAAACSEPVDPNGIGDVLECLLSEILEADVQPISYMIADCGRDGNATRRGNALDSGRNVDPVAVDVVFLNDNVAEIDTDAKFYAFFNRQVGIALTHPPLDLGGAGDRVHHARKLDEHAIAGQLHDAALVLGYLRIEDLAAMCHERSKRPRLVLAHEATVPGHIGGKYRG